MGLELPLTSGIFPLCRNFVYETVPSLKYHNPEVDFAVVRDKEPTGITILRGKLDLCAGCGFYLCRATVH